MTAEGLAATLARAKDAGARLQESTEALNNGLRTVEKTLAELNLGVRATVALETPSEVVGERRRLLGFGKYDNAWRLIVFSIDADNPEPEEEDWEQVPLMNCNRETRAAAVDLLPELVRALAAQAEAEAQAVSTKSMELATFVDELGENEPW